MRGIDEVSDEYMTSEAGSEFDRKTPRAEGSLATRLKAAAIRNQFQSVEKPVTPKNIEINITSEFRPSIFDM